MPAAFAVFEVGNLAATLRILRATDLLAPANGIDVATQIALALYTAYNVAATAVSLTAGRLSDRLGTHGPVIVVAAGVTAFLISYVLFAITGPVIALGVGRPVQELTLTMILHSPIRRLVVSIAQSLRTQLPIYLKRRGR